MLPHPVRQHAHDRAAGGILGVDDATLAVTSFPGQVQFGAAVLAGEPHAVTFQPTDTVRPLADHALHHVRVAQSRAGLYGIGLVMS